ncbi:adenylate cyclase [Paenibacillus darwinianus]|uniref:Adenylate cyclase n=1 Tax=Paenibacillus darwinianus TaxID=1380763 RepID=A0A9W5S228_9BACL|nr:CYTH domain-containing protein [Paenibacillus darwinianus]EXX90198.1 adenylate cyclase [Paenibacillus darwinianus]EXX90863.1 adenylate cyclase [Paenibacillus darwinianus]EXX90916.1 adenylate cyclase [Paenibacillus darwinianus]
MAKEIERKFLVENMSFKNNAEGILYRQGYITNSPDKVVRVRIAGAKGYLTIKTKNIGLTRSEYEYEIPVKDADELLADVCEAPLIEKYRYTSRYEGHTWEIDEFLGANRGLIIAEVELQSEEEAVSLPDWVGAEVSGDPKYYNSSLIKRPYTEWSKVEGSP